MSIETPNRIHAIGLFAPVPSAPFTQEMVESKGIRSFTRTGVGQYTIELIDLVAFGEAMCVAQVPPNTQAIASAQVAADGTIFLSVLDLALGAPVDPYWVTLSVIKWNEGEGASVVVSSLPIPPPIPSGGSDLQQAYNAGLNATIVLSDVRPLIFNDPALGISRGYLSDIERGRKSISIEMLAQFCHKLCISPNRLMGFASSAS